MNLQSSRKDRYVHNQCNYGKYNNGVINRILQAQGQGINYTRFRETLQRITNELRFKK